MFDVPVLTIPVAAFPPGETRTDSVKSTQLDVTYNLRIYVPNDYDASKAYPIIYALDGDTNYTTMAAQMDALQIKALLVAVSRNDLRTKDYNLPPTQWRERNTRPIYLTAWEVRVGGWAYLT